MSKKKGKTSSKRKTSLVKKYLKTCKKKLKKMGTTGIIKAFAPYVILGYFGNKVSLAYRLAEENEFIIRLMNGLANINAAFKSVLPSFHWKDLCIGILAGVAFRLVVYYKIKNAKKYRTGVEYGSARWGTGKDIEPFVDWEDPDNNIILTKTESLRMAGRPDNPVYERNKNVLVIGGSGSGKTRFFVKPNIMQLHSSYVITDPTGNPYIKEKMDLDIQVSKLKLLKANHTSQRYRMEDDIAVKYPAQITALKGKIEGLKVDIGLYNAQKPEDPEQFKMTVAGKTFEDRKEAGTAIIAMCREIKGWNTATEIGEYMGMPMLASFDAFTNRFTVALKGSLSHEVDIGLDPSGNITRINNMLEGMGKKLEEAVTKLDNVEHQLETAKVEVKKPFAQEGELNEKLSRLSELNALLNMDEKGDSPLAMDEAIPSASKISVKQQIADNKTIVSQMGQKVIGLDGPKFAKGVAIGLE
jgi:hypothetical protein